MVMVAARDGDWGGSRERRKWAKEWCVWAGGGPVTHKEFCEGRIAGGEVGEAWRRHTRCQITDVTVKPGASLSARRLRNGWTSHADVGSGVSLGGEFFAGGAPLAALMHAARCRSMGPLPDPVFSSHPRHTWKGWCSK